MNFSRTLLRFIYTHLSQGLPAKYTLLVRLEDTQFHEAYHSVLLDGTMTFPAAICHQLPEQRGLVQMCMYRRFLESRNCLRSCSQHAHENAFRCRALYTG